MWSALVLKWLTDTARLPRSLCLAPTRSPVPRQGPSRFLATLMPEADRPISRSPPTLSRDRDPTPVSTIL